MKNSIVTLSLSSLVLAAGGVATAQPRETITDEVPVMTDALEITIGGSYAQGAGELGGTMSSADIQNPGGGADVSIGVRVTPNLTIGAYGTINGFADNGASQDAATASAGAKADWHFSPSAPTDPWLSLGAGVKTLWSGDRDVLDGTLFGVEVAKAQAGVDFRLTPWFSVGPAVGASVTVYTHETDAMSDSYESIDNKDVNVTLTAGLQGRFDLFGRTR